MIVIVDYGMGNLGSILRILQKIGGRSEACHFPRGHGGARQS